MTDIMIVFRKDTLVMRNLWQIERKGLVARDSVSMTNVFLVIATIIIV